MFNFLKNHDGTWDKDVKTLARDFSRVVGAWMAVVLIVALGWVASFFKP